MSLSVGDKIRTRIRISVDGVNCYNIFHHLITETTPSSGLSEYAFAECFGDTLAPLLKPVMSTSTRLLEVYSENLTDPVRPFGIYPMNAVGTATGQTAPSFVAGSIRQNVATRLTRNGYKRFSGVTEDMFAGGVFIGTFITAYENLANFLGGGTQVIVNLDTPTNAISIKNIVMKSNASVPPLATDYQVVTSGQFMNRVTSQTSRKFFAQD